MNAGSKILLIDDDKIDRMSVIRAFRKVDATIGFDQAPDEETALKLLLENDYVCLLLDYRLGSADGLTLLKRIQEHGLSAAPVVMLSGLDDEEVMLECLKEGAQDYLLKSEITSSSLMRAVRYASERKQAAEELRRIAHYDSLTGLCNRNLFLSTVNHAMAKASRTDKCVALCFIDLDHFKDVNDTLGHEAGDKLLIEMAERISSAVRGADVVGRLGGDEFAVLFTDVEEKNDVVIIAEKILGIVSKPVSLYDKEIQVTPSIGIALYSDGPDTADDLVRYADMAMYHAKKNGRNSFHFYATEMLEYAVKRSSLKTELIEALDRDEFDLYYQPQVDINTGAIKGVEALLRWSHPIKGNISPIEFIPVAEETGLIVSIGDWVLEQACAQLDRWVAQGQVSADEFTMSVNVSAYQLKQGGMSASVAEAIKDKQFRSNQLVLEITESLLIEDIDWCQAVLSDITKQGVRIAIDDFGTGYASFRHMLNLPLSYLKIDKSFIDQITSERKSLEIATAIIAMGRALDMIVVAEGVEDREQSEVLQESGCPLAQGYLFSRPKPSDEILPVLLSEIA